MTVQSFGEFTVGGALPGLIVAFESVAQSLLDLRAVANSQLAIINNASAALEAEVNALAAAQIAIRIPATADFEAQLDAAINIGLSLSAQLVDPSVYLATLASGVLEVTANIGLLDPVVALTGQIDASASVAADMTAKIGAIDAQLSVLGSISAAIQAVVSAIAAIHAALSAAIQAVLGAVSAYFAIAPHLEASGAACFLYTGAAGSIGAEIDAAIAAAGIGGSVDVRVPIVLVPTDNAEAVAGVNAVFRVSS